MLSAGRCTGRRRTPTRRPGSPLRPGSSPPRPGPHQKQLIVAINLNRGITAEYNEKANEQRTALADWLKTLLDPPPNIRNLSPSDPVRQQWGIDVTTRYYDTIQKAQRDQENADASRPRYPDPDCGE